MKIRKPLMGAIAEFRTHAQVMAERPNYPEEACGLILNSRELHICKNIHAAPSDGFAIDPDEWYQASLKGTITHVIHSHVGQSPQPSHADIIGCNAWGFPWIIISSYENLWPDPYILIPQGETPPLVGRQFDYQLANCYTLVRDWYREKLGIELRDYPAGYGPEEWLDIDTNYYEDNFEKEGFLPLPSTMPLEDHDLVLIQTVSPRHCDHVGIIADATKNLLLHHVVGHLSTFTGYGGYWRNNTRFRLRHKSMWNKTND